MAYVRVALRHDGWHGARVNSHALLAFVVVLASCTPAADPGSPAAQPAASTSTRDRSVGDDAGSSTAGADASTSSPAPPWRSDTAVTVLVRGGAVIDGTGRAPRTADVAIVGASIVHVGAVDASVKAERVVDATGMVVTPGFIDAHAHGEALGDNHNFAAMGVTTLCIGQDGRSASDERVRDWAARVRARRPMLNLAPFVGHATVRLKAGVGLASEVRPEQLSQMARIVAEGMDDGAFGLSTGLEYQPGRSAKLAELVAVARPVGERGGVVMSHLRSEDDDTIDAALDELFAQGSGARARVHVAHVKVVYGRGAERADKLLARMADARARGVEVTADFYPYTASYTGIDIVFPDWAKPPHDYRAVVGKRRAELRDWLRRRIAQRNGPDATLFGTPPWTGKTLARVARDLGKPFEDVLIDDIGPNGASAAYFVMDEALQTRLALDAHVMIGSDGSAGSRHPRGYGTFARVIRELVMEKKALTLEEAIRKMTGLPAATLGLDRQRRGLLEPGWAADLVIFDPARVRDTATYEAPNRLAQGFDWVMVNGQVIRERGAFTRARPGQVLSSRTK
jgi:N-acyl-D-amino-acid deacylase